MSKKAVANTPKTSRKNPPAVNNVANNVAAQTIERELGNRETSRLQSSLQVSRPGDADEIEADQVARQVMSMTFDGRPPAQRPAMVQRKCNKCEDELPIQLKAEGPPVSSASIRTGLNGSRGGGRPLSGNVRAGMESAFGADFSSVRIHTADYAVRMSRDLGAQAFTHGSDIYFNRGKFDPVSTSGRHLLAHELTHTLQQGGVLRRKPECFNSEWKEWYEIIDKEIKGKHWGKTKQEKEEIRKRVRGLPDKNKIKVRQMIDECIQKGAVDQNRSATNLLADPSVKAQLPAHKKRVQDVCDAGIKKIRDFRRSSAGAAVLSERGDELDKREQSLLLLKTAMNDDKFAAADYDTFVPVGNQDSRNSELAKDLGNAPLKYRIEDLDYLVYLFGLVGTHGYFGYALGEQNWFIYSGYFSFTRSDLRTAADAKDKPGKAGVSGVAGPSAKPGGMPAPGSQGKAAPAAKVSDIPIPDQEDLGKVREFLRSLEQSDLPGTNADPEELAKLLKDLSQQQLEEFKKFYKQYVVEHDEEKEGALTVEKALKTFLEMSELERETMRTNRALKEQDESAPGPSAARTSLCADKTEEAHKQYEALNQKLEDIQSIPGMDKARQGEFAPLDNSMILFLEEMAMLDGLIDGASRKSTDIADAAKGFWSELDRFRNNLISEMRSLAIQIAVETAAGIILSYLSLGTLAPAAAARIALLVYRLNKLRKLIQRALRIIAIFDTVKDIIGSVRAAGQAYESFRKEFEEGLRRLKLIQQRLDSLEGDEALDEEYERLQEELMEKIQAQLDGQLGEVLQHFFIPPDASEDELTRILMDIPAGVDSLKRVYARYKKGRGKAKAGKFGRILYVMATEAGFKLYPLVGFLTAKAGESLNTLNAELEGKTVADRMAKGLERLVNKSKGHRKKSGADRKSGIRGLFEKIRPNRYDYNDSDIKAVLKKGEAWMNTEFEKMNKEADGSESFNGFWTKALFRFTVRNKVKELNAIRSTFGDVRATLKGKKKKGAAAGTEMKVSPPRFKVKWSSIFSRTNNFFFYLTLNPTSDKIPKKPARPLTYTSFKGKGISFRPKDSKKKKSLYDWLDEEGYLITKNVKGKNFVRHSSRGTGPQGKTWYLQVDYDGVAPRIKQDRKLTVTQKYIPDFYGRLVNTDVDLPEGYVLYTYRGDEGIRARKGIAWLLRKFPLGIDADGKIVGEDKKFPVVETKTEKKAESYENIVNPESIADKMFEPDHVTPNPEYNVKDRTHAWWKKHIRSKSALQQRPTFKHYILGNVKYARSVGDLLSGRHVPELKHGDDKGHLVAKRFGGSDDYDNLIPMKSSINRGNQQGSWYRVEGDMAKEFRRGRKKVEVRINIAYPSAKSRRPHRFHGSFDVLKFNTSTKVWDKESSGSFPKGLKQ